VLEGAEIGAAIGQPADTDHVDFSLMPLPGMATVGSTFLLHEPDHQDWVERILSRAADFVPAVNDAPIRGSRACARPQSVDGRPLIGPVPGLRGLYVCAGHGPWGISTGPASARLVVDQILGRAPAIPLELDIARFGAPPPVAS
jgi:D-hydroxyproline dehydrogenase subunit beta